MQSHYCPAMSVVLEEFKREMSRQMMERDIQQKVVAIRAGYKPSYLSHVLSGKYNITLDTFLRIAEAAGLKVRISYQKASRQG